MILANSSGLTVQLSQSNNSFLVQTMPPRISTFAGAVAVGDLNGDGKADLTVRLTAKVMVAAGGPSPTGLWVTFEDGTVPLGSAILDGTGTAFVDTSMLSAGTHGIIANFQGAQVTTYPTYSILSPSSSAATQVIVSALPTSTALSSSSSTSTSGTVLTFTAIVSSASGTPFGGVTFFDGTQSLGTMALTGTQAAFSTASLTSGSHSITAQFNANNTFASSSSAVSAVTIQAAKRDLAPTLTMVQAHSVSDGTAELTATVSPTSAGGNVIFLADGVILGSAPVNAQGVAVISGFQVNGVIHEITASLAPTSTYAPSSSPTSVDGWQTGTPAFDLSVDNQSIAVGRGKLGVLQLSVIGFAQSAGTAALSCIVPDGSDYTCSIASPQLAYGTSTTITITASSPLAVARLGSLPHVACVVVMLLFISPLRKRENFAVLFVVTLCACTALVGCGATRSATGAPGVLRIEAISGTNPMTVRSMQAFINP